MFSRLKKCVIIVILGYSLFLTHVLIPFPTYLNLVLKVEKKMSYNCYIRFFLIFNSCFDTLPQLPQPCPQGWKKDKIIWSVSHLPTWHPHPKTHWTNNCGTHSPLPNSACRWNLHQEGKTSIVHVELHDTPWGEIHGKHDVILLSRVIVIYKWLGQYFFNTRKWPKYLNSNL